MVPLSVVVCSALLAFAAATDVQQCKGGSIEGLSSDVQLIPCKKIPCKLKKGTEQHIRYGFIPPTDVKDVTNDVTAEVLGVDLPFVGVAGSSICDKLENESGEKVTCPLTAGTKYIYKDSFPVLAFYPTISTKIHWALKDGKKDITCFEVSARIA